MALRFRYLVDTSAFSRIHYPEVKEKLNFLARFASIATCSIVDLERGYSARNHEDHLSMRKQSAFMPRADISQETFGAAFSLQGELARVGKHRLPIHDLIIAACAREHDLTVLHYDSDFDTIASVTGQESAWVVPRGSLA